MWLLRLRRRNVNPPGSYDVATKNLPTPKKHNVQFAATLGALTLTVDVLTPMGRQTGIFKASKAMAGNIRFKRRLESTQRRGLNVNLRVQVNQTGGRTNEWPVLAG